MEFRVKYNVGDEVWFISHNTICSGVVDNICLKITSNGIETCHYHIKSDAMNNGKTVRTEDYICGSREELINKLNNIL